ncbi:MAG: hypothetical protein LBD99_06075 [Candidatus Margulisbacteria bacterium]|jgi:hypothetical protein|nr:hypothetical protein [Candidatus Margulisiibacteriota bacterium]
MQENNQVELQIKPQPKGPLPEVKLKPAENKNEEVAELVTNLVLQKYNKFTARIQALKNKFMSLSWVRKFLKFKQAAAELKARYTDKERNKARLNKLKEKVGARFKMQFVKIDQKLKLSGKFAPIKKAFNKHLWQGKLDEIKEDIKEIRARGKEIVISFIKSRMEKKPAAPEHKAQS